MGDKKPPPHSLPQPMGHLGFPSEVMSFQGNSQILSESAKLELLRNEVTWKETGSGVSKGKGEIAFQALQTTWVVQTSGAVPLQPTQSPLGSRTDLGSCLCPRWSCCCATTTSSGHWELGIGMEMWGGVAGMKMLVIELREELKHFQTFHQAEGGLNGR